MKTMDFLKAIQPGMWVLTDHGAIVKVENFTRDADNVVQVWVSYANHYQNVMILPLNIRQQVVSPKKLLLFAGFTVAGKPRPIKRTKWIVDGQGRLKPIRPTPPPEEYEIHIGKNGRAYSRRKKT